MNELDKILADLTASKKTIDKPSAVEGQLTVDVFQDLPAARLPDGQGKADEKEIVIQTTIGGVKSDDIDVSIAKDMVTIKGRRKREEKIKEENYFHQELYWGTFSRSIILPADIDVDKSKASIKNGLLTIRLPILTKGKTR